MVSASGLHLHSCNITIYGRCDDITLQTRVKVKQHCCLKSTHTETTATHTPETFKHVVDIDHQFESAVKMCYLTKSHWNLNHRNLNYWYNWVRE
jgi:hypothetical protein